MSRTAIGWSWVGGQVVVIAAAFLVPWRSHGAIALVLGFLVVGAGVVLGIAALRSLGPALTPTPVPVRGAGLRTTGVYAVVRHPVYSAILLIAIGLLIAAGTAVGALWLATLIAFFWLKSRWEDRLLRAAYGSQWQAWARRTGALAPSWRTLGR